LLTRVLLLLLDLRVIIQDESYLIWGVGRELVSEELVEVFDGFLGDSYFFVFNEEHQCREE
jgi:hypothetical protein